MKAPFFLLIFLVACAGTPERRMASEPRRVPVDLHLLKVVDSQKMSHASKRKLVRLIEDSLRKHEDLKLEEARLIRILLSQSIRVNDLTVDEALGKQTLLRRLDVIYSEKEKNILEVMAGLREVSDSSSINEELESEMYDYLRVIR